MWNLLFPLSFIYLELVFIFSTGIEIKPYNLVILIFSSIFYGMLCNFLSGLCRKNIVNKIIKSILLAVMAFWIALVYFVYCEFRVFYNLNTIFNAAGDAADKFSLNIKILLLSWNGIFHIILFLLPLICYLILIRRDKAQQYSLSKAVATLATGFIFLSLFMTFKEADDVLAHVYTDEYNFDSAVRQYGVANALRLDTETILFGSRTYKGEETVGGFVLDAPVQYERPVSTPPAITGSTSANQVSGNSVSEDVAVIEEPIVYGPNMLDIDFAALAETTYGDLQSMDLYVASLTPSMQNEYTGLFEGKNLILITAEAFSAEAIDPDLTPTLYRMAYKGIQFNDYYQPSGAGTTGGECSVILGVLPTQGGGSVIGTQSFLNYMTMGYQLNMLGYYGMAYHNNDYTYYSRHLTHGNFGYSNGYMGYGNGIEQYVTMTWPESDLEMIEGTLPTYIDQQPFNIYYMTVSGHSLYSKGLNAMSAKHWDEVAELPYSDTVKAYFACQLELEAAMTYLIEQLEEKGIADDTVIVISADHFPYGLDSQGDPVGLPYLSELYGQSVTNGLYRDHNRLIIWSGCLEDMDPIIVDEPTFSPDITPTLLNLFGVQFDSRLMVGRDVLSDAQPLVFDLGYNWKTDLGTYLSATGFVPVSEDVEIPEGYVDTMKAIVRNKLNYCKLVLTNDYYRHVFEE